METWLELAVLHEAGHAWLVLTLAERPVAVIIPPIGGGDDPRCEWDAGAASPAAAVMVAVGGLAAELLAGVPEDLEVGANPCGRPCGQEQVLPLPQDIEKIPRQHSTLVLVAKCS